MKLGRVRGTVVASTQVAGVAGFRWLLVQPLDDDLNAVGGTIVAADAVAMAGPEDLVYYVSSREAAEAMSPRFVPVDDAIVGLVDQIHVERR